MGKFAEQWKEKSDRTLGNLRGKGIFVKMLFEQNKALFKDMMKVRKPRPDNSRSKDELDLI